jgi:hypothetical protein
VSNRPHRDTGKAKTYEVALKKYLLEDVDFSFDENGWILDMMIEEVLEKYPHWFELVLYDTIIRNLFINTPRAGDVFHFAEWSEYRNDGRLIFNGNQLVELDSEFDDYGSVPTSMLTLQKPGGYPMFYFEGSIFHDSLHHFDLNQDNLRDQLLNNRQGDVTKFQIGTNIFRCDFTDRIRYGDQYRQELSDFWHNLADPEYQLLTIDMIEDEDFVLINSYSELASRLTIYVLQFNGESVPYLS